MNSCQSLVKDQDSVDFLMTSKINQFYFVTAYEYIGLEDAETPKAKKTLQILLWYHINSPVWYKDCITPLVYFTNTEHYLIGATILISSLIEITFDHPYEHQVFPLKKEMTTEIVQKLMKKLTTFVSAFVSMSDSGHFSPQNLCQNLSKCFITFNFFLCFVMFTVIQYPYKPLICCS